MTDIRIALNDKAIAHLPAPGDGWYLARDTELKGFFVVVGKRKRTFTVQGDLRQRGKRASSIRVSIGDDSELTTQAARARRNISLRSAKDSTRNDERLSRSRRTSLRRMV